jgi:hypothetical protein
VRVLGLALVSAVRALALERPLLLPLDDVQWVDASSAEILAFMLRRLEDEPVGVLATALAVSGRKAWYAGFGTDGRPFLVYAEDNGPIGRGDVFRMWIGGVEQTNDGKVAKGDVAVTS